MTLVTRLLLGGTVRELIAQVQSRLGTEGWLSVE